MSDHIHAMKELCNSFSNGKVTGCTETVQPTFLLLFFFNTILSFVHIHQCILHSVEILKKPGYHKRNKSFKSIKLNLSCVSANALTESVKPAFEKQ